MSLFERGETIPVPPATPTSPTGHVAVRHPPRAHGAAVQWGTARMPGTFLADAPPKVPAEVVGFAAERFDAD
ncbi:hypothetical protein AB0J28_40655 [Streptosporangium canum]|uniref:hypothetical protein n=1 Tax=Streptosporangium canum TaxID=324952 RepID=UPI00341FA8FD